MPPDQKCVDAMGQDMARTYHFCENEWVRARLGWHQWELHYRCSSEQIDFLNRSGGNFFSLARLFFFEVTIQCLCRLTDPEKDRAGNQNICLDRLLRLAEDPLDQQLHGPIKTAKAATAFARTWRNKRIAHNDLSVQFGEGVLAGVPPEQMHTAFSSIHDVLALVHRHYLNSSLSGYWPSSPSDATATLQLLWRGHTQAEDDSNIPWEDWEKKLEFPPWLGQIQGTD